MLFLALAPGADPTAVAEALRSRICSELTPRHVPDRILTIPILPRTLNGKRCEVPAKRILGGAAPNMVISRDSLSDPAGFDSFLQTINTAAPRVGL